MKFGGQTSNNVHDVRKVYLEKTLCVSACVIKFYVFVFDEIYVKCTKIVYNHVWVGNVWENIPKDHTSFLEEGPFKSAQESLPTEGNRRPMGQSTPRWWCLIHWDLSIEEEIPNVSLWNKRFKDRTVRRLPTINGSVPSCSSLLSLRGELVNSPHVQIRVFEVP